MQLFQNKIFIFFLILAITFVAFPKITQAGQAIAFFVGWAINAVVGMFIGDIIFIASFYCGFGGPVGNCDSGSFSGSMGSDVPVASLGSFGCLYGVPINLSENSYTWDVYRKTTPDLRLTDAQIDAPLGKYGCLYSVPIAIPPSASQVCVNNYLQNQNGTGFGGNKTISKCFAFNDWQVIRNNKDISKDVNIFSVLNYIIDKTTLAGSILKYDIKAKGGNIIYNCWNGWSWNWNGLLGGNKNGNNNQCVIAPPSFSVSATTSNCPSDEKQMVNITIQSQNSYNLVNIDIIPTEGSQAINYDVYRDGLLIGAKIPISQTTYQDKGLNEGEYVYRIDVRDAGNLTQEYGPVSVPVLSESKFIGNFTGAKYIDKTAPASSALDYELKTTAIVSYYCCNPGRTDCNAWCPNYGPYSKNISVTTPSCQENETAMAEVKITKQGCDYIELSVAPMVGSSASNYDVYRNGALIKSDIPISQKTYKDENLSQKTDYTYTVDVRNADNLIQTYGPVSAKTVCLADCSFSANPGNLAYPDTNSSLSWSCQNAVSCSISGGIGDVSPNSGTVPVIIDKTTAFILTCGNSDAEKSFSTAVVNVSRPTIIEVPPR